MNALPLFVEMVRAFRRSRLTFAAIVLTLGIGVAVNTTLLSLVRSMLVTTVPMPRADRIIQISAIPPDWKPGDFMRTFSVSWPNLQDIRESSALLAEIAAYYPQSMTLTGRGDPLQVQSVGVSDAFFAALGSPAFRGRLPTPDEINGRRPVVVVSHRFWRKHLESEGALEGGRQSFLNLNDQPYEVIGVLPPRVELPLQFDAWVPLRLTDLQRTNRSSFSLSVVGRLADGATIESAQTELDAISARLSREYPDHNGTWRHLLMPVRMALLGNNSRSVLLIQGGAALLLMMAMFNMALLLYAQAAQRAQESAVRMALGASGRRLAGESLLTTLALLIPGVALGLFGAGFGLPVLGAINPVPGLAYFFEDLALRWDVACVSAGLALVLGLIAGILPAWQQSTANTASVLSENIRGGGLGPTVLRTQRWLMQAQIAVTTMLLFAAMVLGLSYRELARSNFGYETDDRVAFQFALPQTRYPTVPDQQRFVRQLQDRLSAQSWHRNATVTATLPVNDISWASRFSAEPSDPAALEVQSENYYRITETYLETMGMVLLRGRNIDARDNASAPPVVLVNDAFARKYWPGKDPVGQRLWRQRSGQIEISEVVGIVSDSIIGTPRTGVVPIVFFPIEQTVVHASFAVIAHSDLPPAASLALAREALWSIDPNLTTNSDGPLQERVANVLAIDRFQSGLVLALGGFGLAISLLGLGGLALRIVTARETELAIRTALGATPSMLIGMLINQLGRLVLVGSLAGIAGAWALSRAIQPDVFGTTANSVLPYLAAPALLLALALLSLTVPFLRAARANPADILRS